MISARNNVSLLLDRNLEAGRGDKVAIWSADPDGTVLSTTYTQLAGLASRAGRALLDAGVTREQRVLLVMDDTPAFPATFLGAIRIGAVPAPVNPLYKTSDYTFFIEDSYARAVVTDAALADKVGAAVAALPSGSRPRVLLGSDLGGDHVGGAAGDLIDPVVTHEDDMAFWLYSSGSTGRPKGVIHRQVDVAFTCETFGAHVLRLTEDDVTFSTSKLFHAYGLGNGISFPYWVGATTVLNTGKPLPDVVFGLIDRHRPTAFFSVPTVYNLLLSSPRAQERDLSSVRVSVSAAEPLPPEVGVRWHKAFGITILDGIGSTEMLHIYCANTPEAGRPGTSGRAVAGYELEIRDEEGRVVGPGGVGELFVKGDSALAGYWHHRDRTRRTLVGEWFATGDRYRRDDDGYYVYEGRADDMMKVGGLWVSPIEMENVLVEHPSVLEAAVVGVEVDGLMKIRAHVVCRPGTEAGDGLVGELVEWCKNRLQRYQYPHVVVFTDELPKTVTGKIQRFALRAQSIDDRTSDDQTSDDQYGEPQ